MKKPAPPIAVIGNANLDLVGGILAQWPEQGTETFMDRSDLRIGGSAANTALVLKRLGATFGLISAAGNDLIGDMIRAAFQDELDRISLIEQNSSVTFGVLHGGAERTFFSTRGHLDVYDERHIQTALRDWPLQGALVMLSGSFAMPALCAATTELLKSFRKSGARVVIDPGWPDQGWTPSTRALMADWIALSDIILINDKELLGFSGLADIELAMKDVAIGLGDGAQLVIKRGARGASSLSGAGTAHDARALPMEVFDTIGAGDAFNAGYLAAVQAGHDALTALCMACNLASEVVAEFPRSDRPLTLTKPENLA